MVSEPTAASPGSTGLGQVTNVAVRAEHVHPGWSPAFLAFLQAADRRRRDLGNSNGFRGAADKHFALAGEKRFPLWATSVHHSSSLRSAECRGNQIQQQSGLCTSLCKCSAQEGQKPEAMVASCNHTLAC